MANTKQHLYKFFAVRLYILAWTSLLLLLLGQVFGRLSWQLELFSHFTVYYAVVLLISSIIYPSSNMQSRVWRIATRGVFIVVAVSLMIWSFVPVYQIISNWYTISDIKVTNTKKNDSNPFIVYQNVNIDNNQQKEALAELIKYDSDIMILLEAGGDWLTYLQSVKKIYPVHCGDNQASPFAMQVFIKRQRGSCEIIAMDMLEDIPVDIPMMKITVSAEQVIYVIHPPPPVNSELAKYRLAYLQAVRDMVIGEGLKTDVMVIGDMNSTRFSPVYRDFIQDTSLYPTTTAGLSTWRPLYQLKVPFGIGIDHYLTTMGWHNDVQVLGFNGSDHRGLLVR